MPRAGLTHDVVVRAAGELADEDGYQQLTLAGLAQRLGVKQPSLYKHISSLDGLHRGMAVSTKRELGEAIARAAVGLAGADALRAIAHTYRSWVAEHPGRYAATVRAPDVDDEDDQRASTEMLLVVVDVLDGLGLSGDHAIDAARAVRSALHGFVTLELAGGFGLPRDLAASFEFLIETLVVGLSGR